jgi:ABC-type Mn2+/Zn2+ transport system permease subunit
MVVGTLATLVEPLSDATTGRALLEIILLGTASGAVGCWVVLYGLSYGAESLAHSLLPGLVIAALTGIPLVVGGAAAMLVAALAIAIAGRLGPVDADTGIAVVVTTMFGAGVLLALSPESPQGINELLFGDVLGVSDSDLLLSAALAVAVLVALPILHGRLLAVGFDRSSAPAIGASPPLADAAVLVLLAATVLVAVQALGNLLVVATLIAPAAAARLHAHRAAPMMVLAVGLAWAGGLGGIYLSYYADTAAGASIAIAMVLLYLAALALSGVRGSAALTAGPADG